MVISFKREKGEEDKKKHRSDLSEDDRLMISFMYLLISLKVRIVIGSDCSHPTLVSWII